MIEITMHDQSTILVTGANARHGAQLTTIPNREYIKRGHKWTVPLSRLDEVIRICGLRNDSIDPAVFRAREEQLQRMVAQYAACGIRIWNDAGRVATDNEALTDVLQPIAKLLTPFLATIPGPQRTQRRKVVRVVAEAEKAPQGAGISLQAWLTGVQNAAKAAEREQAMRGRRR